MSEKDVEDQNAIGLTAMKEMTVIIKQESDLYHMIYELSLILSYLVFDNARTRIYLYTIYYQV